MTAWVAWRSWPSGALALLEVRHRAGVGSHVGDETTVALLPVLLRTVAPPVECQVAGVAGTAGVVAVAGVAGVAGVAAGAADDPDEPPDDPDDDDPLLVLPPVVLPPAEEQSVEDGVMTIVAAVVGANVIFD